MPDMIKRIISIKKKQHYISFQTFLIHPYSLCYLKGNTKFRIEKNNFLFSKVNKNHNLRRGIILLCKRNCCMLPYHCIQINDIKLTNALRDIFVIINITPITIS